MIEKIKVTRVDLVKSVEGSSVGWTFGRGRGWVLVREFEFWETK